MGGVEDDVIYFSVTSDGTTGEDWIKRLKDKGFLFRKYVEQVLCSPDFKPTNGVTTKVAVLKGRLFENKDRITRKIYVEGDKRKLLKPNAELACLIREKFTDEEIKAMRLLDIAVVHKTINDSDGTPYWLVASCRHGDGWLEAYHGNHDLGYPRDMGFAFAESQVDSQD